MFRQIYTLNVHFILFYSKMISIQIRCVAGMICIIEQWVRFVFVADKSKALYISTYKADSLQIVAFRSLHYIARFPRFLEIKKEDFFLSK